MRKKRYLILAIFLIIFVALTLYLGNIPPSPLYYLKISRETIQSLFIFGDEDQANWYLTRADKRINEAQKLKDRNMDFFAQIQIKTALDYQRQAEILLEVLKNKTNITYLEDKSNQNRDKLKSLEAN